MIKTKGKSVSSADEKKIWNPILHIEDLNEQLKQFEILTKLFYG